MNNIGRKTTALVQVALRYALAGRSVTFVSADSRSRKNAVDLFLKECNKGQHSWCVDNDGTRVQVGRITGDPITVWFRVAITSAASSIHTNILILDDAHRMDPDVVRELSYIPAPVNGFEALTIDIDSLWATQPAPACECGSSKLGSPIHSSWCPLGGP